MLAFRGEVSKHVTDNGTDPTGSCRLNYVDVVNKSNKVRFISASQCVKSKSTPCTVHIQRRRCFIARRIAAYPRKLFILHLTQFTSDFISLEIEVILNVDANMHVIKGKLSKN